MKSACLILCCLLLAGCVRSLHPFYLDSQLVYDPALLGTWVAVDESNKDRMTITGEEANKQYRLIYEDESAKAARFIVHLAKLQDQYVGDLLPDELKIPDSDVYKAHLLPLHSFVLVSYNAGGLKIRLMDPEWLKKQLEAQPNLLKHELVDKEPILTAPTELMQEFILKNIPTPGAFGEAKEYRWQGPTTRP